MFNWNYQQWCLSILLFQEILDVKKHDCVVETIISSKGSDPIKYLNEVTVNSFEAMQLSPVLRTQLKLRMLKYIQEENAPVKVKEILPVILDSN